MGLCPSVHGPHRDVGRRNVQGVAEVCQATFTICALHWQPLVILGL